MLSLRNYDIPTLEVEAPDGEILHVLPASKRVIEELAALKDRPEDVGAIYRALAECLSANREGKKIEAARLEELPLTVVKDLLTEYARFIRGRVDDAKNS